MRKGDLRARLDQSRQPLGGESRTLVLGDRWVRIEGLGRELAAGLERRWGAFLADGNEPRPGRTVRVYAGGRDKWLEQQRSGEPYRLEAVDEGLRGIVASYHFALDASNGTGAWRLAITEGASEPLERVVDNALRFVAARIAVDEGGFAMHAAGVLRDDRAYLFAGPSGSGKTTAVALAAPAQSLGDDFALVVPRDDRWVAPALPFDNSERIVHTPPAGLFPVAGIWRLHRSTTTRSDGASGSLGIASLMGCAAFPWAMPELSEALMRHVQAFVATGGFHHLHFTRQASLWTHLVGVRD